MRTGQVAKAVGLHPNTIRLYEEWGLLPPVARSSNGYRVFNQSHVDQVRLIQLAFACTWIGGEIRQKARAVIGAAAAGDFSQACAQAREHQALILRERRRAEHAARTLESWAQENDDHHDVGFLGISETARLLDVTIDQLRNWERNGLISVPRDPVNGYRLYGRREIRRLRVIRVLRRARYSNMAILRMMRHLDAGESADVRRVLDTPESHEDVVSAADRWLSSLCEAEDQARQLTDFVSSMSFLDERKGDDF